MRNLRFRLLPYLALVYLLLAFLWWSVLLFTKNRDAFNSKIQAVAYVMAAEGRVETPMDFYTSEVYQELRRQYRRQEWMIVGESLLLIGSILFSIYIVHRGYVRELNSGQQQRNFLLSITHELKSPIAGIRLILETFKKRELTPELQQRLSHNGLRETDRLTALVEDLLLSAKLETGYQLNLEPLDLAEMVMDVVNKIQTKYPDAIVHTHLPQDLPFVNGDRQGMMSLLINLVENAAKYAHPEPIIDITLRTNIVGDIEVEIADNGMGIPEAEKKKVFEKFYRVGNEDTRSTKGTGLGLFIVRELVARHNGTIVIRDNQPRGTRFVVTLPSLG